MRVYIRCAILAMSLALMAPCAGQAGWFESGQDDKASQIDFFVDLGVIKYGKENASGSREILVLTRDNTGVYTHQHLTDADGTDFQAIMQARGIIKTMRNPETGKPEKHLMVFNPKDNHTYAWVPLSQLKEVRKQINKTGKTVMEPAQPKRVTESDLNLMNFDSVR